MLFFAAVLSLSFVAANSQAQQRETMIEENYAVQEDGILEVNVGDADVEVTSGTSNEVHVEVVLEGRDMERAREYYDRENFSVTQSGNTVRVETNPRRRVRFDWRDWRDHPHIYVRVRVPESFNADLQTSDGDISLDRLRGDVRLRTSDGDVTAGTLQGAQISLGTSDGDVRVETLEGDIIEIETSDGDLDLGRLTAQRIFARTSDGDIRTGALQGEVEVKTSDGDITIASFNGTNLFARTSDGDITIDELISESSTVRTSDGSITVRHVEGDLDASGSSADLRLTLVRPGMISATTSDGDVSLNLPPGYGADLRLRGDGIRVASSLDFNGRIDDESADGTINGGGPMIEGRTSNGDVTVRGN